MELDKQQRKIRAVIVDDEALARARVRRLLQKDPEVEIVAECSGGKEAVAVVKEQKPDVLFLDIQMPEMDGFAVLESLTGERVPFTIFITAYNQYAIRAFEALALDYLLKPFNESRLQKALARVKEQVRLKENDRNQELLRLLLNEWKSKPQYQEQLAVKEEGRSVVLRVYDIDWIEAETKYVRIHIGKTSYVLRESLSVLETRLNPKRFLRIHRSTIINISRVKEYHSLFHGDLRILLHDGTSLTLSRSYRKKFEELFVNAAQ